jgi:lipoate synthase
LRKTSKARHSLITKKNEYKDQLKKGKEIMKEFVLWANWEGANCPNFKDIQSKAEQFIKEIEK